jgi:hypothetical protein
LPTNIKLGCKGLPDTNTPAYHKNLWITAVKRFIGLAPDPSFVSTSDIFASRSFSH